MGGDIDPEKCGTRGAVRLSSLRKLLAAITAGGLMFAAEGFAAPQLHISNPSHRFLPIADGAANAFARLAQRCDFVAPDDYAFCSRLGRPLDGSALRRRFKGAAAAAGLRVLRFHALRHGAGSLAARQADPRWVQGFLGHSKLATTERYLHAKARPEDLERLNRAFALAGASEATQPVGAAGDS
jgi:integrase